MVGYGQERFPDQCDQTKGLPLFGPLLKYSLESICHSTEFLHQFLCCLETVQSGQKVLNLPLAEMEKMVRKHLK